MPYSDRTKEAIANAPVGLGKELGVWSLTRDISVLRIAKATGATRQTVYNWFLGGEVANAYKQRVEKLIEILKNTPHTEDAWRNICQTFCLEF
jgi:hypothetical protein